MELLLASLDLKETVDEVEVLSSMASIKEKKDVKRRENKEFGIISTNLDNTNFVHAIFCKEATNTWNTLCNVYKSRNFSNML